MNVTFLIGNGFDIGVGMKTRYKDFYPEYLKLQTDDENILNFQKEIAENINDWADFEEGFGKHAQYFGNDESERYLLQYEHFFEYFAEYLQKEERVFEMPTDLEVINLMDRALSNYYKKLQRQDQDAIENLYAWRHDNVTYNFINFNYTTILDSFLDVFKASIKGAENNKIIGKVIHVHGLINKYMIIGVNDSSQIANKAFAENQEVLSEIVKPNINKELKMGYDGQATELIKKSDIICIYGMSLGITDRKWWQLLAKWLSQSAAKRLIILNYQPDCDTTLPYTWIRGKNKILNKFLSYSKLSLEEREKLGEQICVGINHNIFMYKKSKKRKMPDVTVATNADFNLQQKSMQLLTEIGERKRNPKNDQL